MNSEVARSGKQLPKCFRIARSEAESSRGEGPSTLLLKWSISTGKSIHGCHGCFSEGILPEIGASLHDFLEFLFPRAVELFCAIVNGYQEETLV